MPALIVIAHKRQGNDSLLDLVHLGNMNQLKTVSIEHLLSNQRFLIFLEFLLIHHAIIKLNRSLINHFTVVTVFF